MASLRSGMTSPLLRAVARRPVVAFMVTEEFLAERGITTVVHGDDLSPEGAEFVYGPAAAAGKLTFVRRTGGISTTQLLQRVLDAAASRSE